MDRLADIKEKLYDLHQKTRDGLVFESLGELLLALRRDQPVLERQAVILPEGGDLSLALIKDYQERWLDTPDELKDQLPVDDQDLQIIYNQLANPVAKYRDTGAFFFLGAAVQSGNLTADQLRWLTKRSISDQHLLSHILEELNDGAYDRSYSLAFLAILLARDRGSEGGGFIDQTLMAQLVDQVAVLSFVEVDTRGFVDEKGWVHIFAHLANVLNELFEHPKLRRADKIFLMATVMSNFAALTTPLTMGEVGQLVGALVDLTRQHDLYADFGLINLKLWRQDIVNEPYQQTRARWQQLYNRMQFFHEVIVCGRTRVPEAIMDYVLVTKNYLS
ncbi:DUF2785 domain-containing protein [Leuconostocaceae bacterium ESL0723]|nr:DUF2785 domain-containing protein [Leuconostocaceae bacterium ESL0723]